MKEENKAFEEHIYMGNWFLFFFLMRGTGFHLGWAIGEDRPEETLN